MPKASRTIDISAHSGWGDSIYFWDYEKRIVTGHMTPKPKIGDKIKVEMKWDYPGRYFKLFTVVKLEEFSYPGDHFFADVVDTGVVIEKDGREIVAELGSKCPLCRKKFRKDFLKMKTHLEKKHRDKLTGTL